LGWVVLDAAEKEDSTVRITGDMLIETLQHQGQSFSYFKLAEMNICPCISCGACGIKKPGECAHFENLSKKGQKITRS